MFSSYYSYYYYSYYYYYSVKIFLATSQSSSTQTAELICEVSHHYRNGKAMIFHQILSDLVPDFGIEIEDVHVNVNLR